MQSIKKYFEEFIETIKSFPPIVRLVALAVIVLFLFFAFSGESIFNKKIENKLPDNLASYDSISTMKPSLGVKQNEAISANFDIYFSLANTPKDGIAKVYEYTESDILSEGRLKELIAKFGFKILEDKNFPNQGRILVAITDDSSKSLKVLFESQKIQFQNEIISTDMPFETEINEKDLQKIMLEAKNIIGNDVYNFDYSNISYQKGPRNSEAEEVNGFKGANSAVISLNLSINGLEVIDRIDSLRSNSLTIRVNSEREIIMLSMDIGGKVGSEKYQTELVSIEKLKENISAGKYKIIEANNVDPRSKITDITIKSGYLGYSPASGYLIPVYVLVAQSNDKIDFINPGLGHTILLITDAIEKEN